MNRADLPAVIHIEQQAIASPWTPAQLQEELDAPNSLALVAMAGEQLCGYAFYRTCPPESELLHMVVDPQHQRQQIGTTLLRQGLDRLLSLGCTDCFLEVRSSNQGARLLYTHAGFRQTGIRRQYYQQPDEDALVLTMSLVNRSGDRQ